MIPPVEEIELEQLSSTNLLQSPVWAKFKGEFGWDARAFRPGGGPWAGGPLLVLTRKFGPGASLSYVPYGPTPPDRGSELPAAELRDLGRALAAAQPTLPLCTRFDPLWSAGSLAPTGHGREALRKAPVDIQPPSTVLIRLDDDPDQILAAMHKKNRYNIRLAGRSGVEISTGAFDDLVRWYDIYRVTAARDRITIHPLRYYQRLFVLASESGDVALHLYLAWHDGDLLAGIVVAEVGNQATYLYGASSNDKRNLMPNYALQWHAMQSARSRGMASYDLFGVPRADDPAHPMHGLYRFKTGFGGVLVHRVGSWDAVARPAAYLGYCWVERVRSLYFHRLRKLGAR